MLEIRTCCENCGKSLSNDCEEAMICTFECTFCRDCVSKVLFNVCPNCGGGFEKRPIRPKGKLEKYPASPARVFKPVDPETFAPLLEANKNCPPGKR